MRRKSDGQVLVLFAVVVTALAAVAALAIDVSGAYAARRMYRSAADAAALAGAQDLQVAGPARTVPTAAQYTTARASAARILADQFGASSSCATVGSTATCSFGTLPYVTTIRAPLASAADCESCDYLRSVQVGVTNPAFGVSFARLFGVSNWTVSTSSVAGLQFTANYAIVTLRPPNAGSIPDVKDIAINGGTVVSVSQGDVGSNANMEYSGSNSIMRLDPGFHLNYYDPFHGPLWGTNPAGTKIHSMIADPNYRIPSSSGAPTSGQDTTNCTTIAAQVFADAGYAAFMPAVSGSPDMTKIRCFKPGVYTTDPNGANGEVLILEPGLYFFNAGLTVQGGLIGGYTPSASGVALVFPQNKQFKVRTGGSAPRMVALNAGTRFGDRSSGTEATAALDYAGGLVQTNGPHPVLMTLIVQKDVACTVSPVYPAACDDQHNDTLDLSGGSALYLAGVQYAATDNTVVAGNTSATGYVGQVWAWTLVYTGGSPINMEGATNTGTAVIRLDAACTAPGTPCSP